MRCVNGDGVGKAPVNLTENVQEMLCAPCLRSWLAAPDYRLALQLLALGRNGDAISQYRNWQSGHQRTRRAA